VKERKKERMQTVVSAGDEDRPEGHGEIKLIQGSISHDADHETVHAARAPPSITSVTDELSWLGRVSNDMAKRMVMQVQRMNPGISKKYRSFLADPLFDPSSFAIKFVRKSHVSPSVVLVGYFYLHQVVKKHPTLKITNINATRLVTIACTSAAKFVDDQAMRYTNKHWVHIVGDWVSLRKFNQMEIEFLSLMDFDLSINLPAFHSFCKHAGVKFRDLAR
jgi:hypothetical protein